MPQYIKADRPITPKTPMAIHTPKNVYQLRSQVTARRPTTYSSQMNGDRRHWTMDPESSHTLRLNRALLSKCCSASCWTTPSGRSGQSLRCVEVGYTGQRRFPPKEGFVFLRLVQSRASRAMEALGRSCCSAAICRLDSDCRRRASCKVE